jgi:hypothetical protein
VEFLGDGEERLELTERHVVHRYLLPTARHGQPSLHQAGYFIML